MEKKVRYAINCVVTVGELKDISREVENVSEKSGMACVSTSMDDISDKVMYIVKVRMSTDIKHTIDMAVNNYKETKLME